MLNNIIKRQKFLKWLLKNYLCYKFVDKMLKILIINIGIKWFLILFNIIILEELFNMNLILYI